MVVENEDDDDEKKKLIVKEKEEAKEKENPVVIDNISFKVGKNKIIALVGKSGCGKTTIVNLLERFYDVDEGEIKYCGVNIKELEPRWLHK